MLKLEGRLVGIWVDELEACWADVQRTLNGRHLRVDLLGAHQIDDRGRALLARMHEVGADFLAAGCEMREVIREIAGPGREVYLERT